MSNNDYFPWDEIPDSNVFPTMTGRFEFTKLEDGFSSTGKRMPRAQFTCIEPTNYAGMSHFENFVVGTDENPEGITAGTMGARSLKAALNASQVQPKGALSEICAMVTASKPQLGLSIVHSVEQGGEYAGQERNRITAYKKIGEFEVKIAPRPGIMGAGAGVATGGGVAAPQPAMPAQPMATPAPPQAPAAPIPQQPAMPSAPVAQMPAAPAPPAAPAAPVQPASVAPVAPTAPAAPAAAAPTGYAIPCQICATKGNPNNLIPQPDFANHVARHQQDPNWNGVG